MLLKKSPLLPLDLLVILSSQNFLFTSFKNLSDFFRKDVRKRRLFPKPLYCFSGISVTANPISVRLKSKRQRINTVTLYLRDIATPLVGVVFKVRCALSRSLMFLNKGVYVFAFTRLPSSRLILDLLLSHFDLLVSSDSLTFLILYLASADSVFGCSQLN